MKKIFYTTAGSMIVIAGLFIGMVKGQEVRQKWVAKQKIRQEEKRMAQVMPEAKEVELDDFEVAAFHS